jgi:hypothetical protein
LERPARALRALIRYRDEPERRRAIGPADELARVI